MTEFEYDDDSEGKISDYNSALFINQRLHELWKDANKHKRNGAYAEWNGDLDALWCELAGDVDENSLEEKKFLTFGLELKKCNPIQNWNASSSFDGSTEKLLTKKTQQYKVLMDKEIFLRRLQNKQGKGTKYREAADDYMDN